MKNKFVYILLLLLLISCNKKSVNKKPVNESLDTLTSSFENVSKFITFPQGLSTFDKLPINKINKIARDSIGRMYIATDMGLAISDDNGITFSTLTTANGLRSNRIDNVIILRDDLICLIVSGGILQITKDRGQSFLNVSNDLWDVADVDLYNDSLYVVSASKLYSLSLDLTDLEIVDQTNHKSIMFFNNKLYAIKSSNIYVAEFQDQMGEYVKLSNLEGVILDSIEIYQDRIYLDTHGNGLIVLDMNGNEVSRFFQDDFSGKYIEGIAFRNNEIYFSVLNGVYKAEIGQDNILADFKKTSKFNNDVFLKPGNILVTDQNIFVSTSDNGIGKSSLEGDLSFDRIINDTYQTSIALKTLSNDEYVFHLFNHGIYRVKKDGSDYSAVHQVIVDVEYLSDFYLMDDSSIYVSSSKGVKLISADGQTTTDIAAVSGKHCNTLLFNNNKLYVATNSNGLYIINADSTSVNLEAPNLLSNNILFLQLVGDKLIVASPEGLNFLNSQNQVERSLTIINNFELNQYNINSLFYNEPENMLYIGYKSGILKLNTNGDYVNFKELDLIVSSISSNDGNFLLLATWGGIKIIDKDFNIFKSFDIEDGISASKTNHIVFDGNHIYVSTDAGVSKSILE